MAFVCRCLLLVVIGFVFAVPAVADSITINASSRGWYRSDGSTNGAFFGNNYFVGDSSSDLNEFRNWFRFSIAGLSGPITGAILLLDVPLTGYFSVNPTETYTVFDINASHFSGLGSASTAIFSDLGSGTAFGSYVGGEASEGTTAAIALNAAALAAINAASGGTFALGGALTSLDSDFRTDEALFGFSHSSGTRARLFLTDDPVAVPEPASLVTVLGGFAFVAVAALRRKFSA